MDILLEKIKGLVQDARKPGSFSPILPKNSYNPHPFTEKNFHAIPHAGESKSVAFIDGGQAILLDAPHFCLGFIRSHAVIYMDAKRLYSKTAEGYVLVSSSPQSGNTHYSAEFLPLKGMFPSSDLLKFDSFDETIRTGMRKFSPSSLINIARRFSELQLASEIMGTLENGDMVVLDGSLQHSYTHEDTIISNLNRISTDKSIMVIGVIKTNSILTTSGDSFTSCFGQQSGKWYYSPIADPINNAPHLSAVRLHEKSSHVFMIESFKELKSDDYTLLASYSSDPVFLGYPYGLIEADRAARVSKEEASYLQTKLIEKLGNNSALKASLSSKNAHGILDAMRF